MVINKDNEINVPSSIEILCYSCQSKPKKKRLKKKTEINVTQHIYITFDAITTGSYYRVGLQVDASQLEVVTKRNRCGLEGAHALLCCEGPWT